jgi:hypothetical protein
MAEPARVRRRGRTVAWNNILVQKEWWRLIKEVKVECSARSVKGLALLEKNDRWSWGM